MINNEETQQKFGYEFSTCRDKDKVVCTCDYCGESVLKLKADIKRCGKVTPTICCSNNSCKQKKREETQLTLYGVKNAGGTQISLEKSKATQLERYGVDNVAKLDSSKAKSRATCLEKYGKEHYLATPECREKLKDHCLEKGGENPGQIQEYRDKAKETSLERYDFEYYSQTQEWLTRTKETNFHNLGYENPFLSPDIKSKIIQTNQDKYGNNYPIQNPEVKKRAELTMLHHYGVRHFPQSDQYQEKRLKSNFEKYGTEFPTQNKEIRKKIQNTNLKNHGNASYLGTKACQKQTIRFMQEEFGVDYYSQTEECKEKINKTCMERYGMPAVAWMRRNRKFGKSESLLGKWLNSLGFNFKSNYTLIPGREIDLYEGSLGLGIEYCGLFWHNEMSPAPRGQKYHIEKYNRCRDLGVRLITIFEDEWIGRKEQCQNFLLSVLGKTPRKIHARSCDVVEIRKDELFAFCENHHIQGRPRSCLVAFGIKYEGELLGVMSLSHHHRQNHTTEAVLNRFCMSSDTHVAGGASRLFSRCRAWAAEKEYKSIISWSDNRWSDGNVYKKLGFTFHKEIPEDYSYVIVKKPSKRISKQSCMKRNTGCPKEMTERDWATSQGLARIWDCGKKRWAIAV